MFPQACCETKPKDGGWLCHRRGLLPGEPEPGEQLPMPEPREQLPMELEAGHLWHFHHCVVCLHNCGKEAALALNPLGAKQRRALATARQPLPLPQMFRPLPQTPPPYTGSPGLCLGSSRWRSKGRTRQHARCTTVCKSSKPSLKVLTHQSALLSRKLPGSAPSLPPSSVLFLPSFSPKQRGFTFLYQSTC